MTAGRDAKGGREAAIFVAPVGWSGSISSSMSCRETTVAAGLKPLRHCGPASYDIDIKYVLSSLADAN
jgi:hypothetical protein